MEHIAIWEGDGTNTPETTWLEEVPTAIPKHPNQRHHAGKSINSTTNPNTR
jgi:hypothetical protein